MAADRLLHVVQRAVGIALDELRATHDHARRAEAALQGVVLDESLLHRVQYLAGASPSIVVIALPRTSSANVMQLAMTSPSTQTVHAEQAPRSHPTFVPVSPSVSRSTSTSVVAGSARTLRASPLIRSCRESAH